MVVSLSKLKAGLFWPSWLFPCRSDDWGRTWSPVRKIFCCAPKIKSRGQYYVQVIAHPWWQQALVHCPGRLAYPVQPVETLFMLLWNSFKYDLDPARPAPPLRDSRQTRHARCPRPVFGTGTWAIAIDTLYAPGTHYLMTTCSILFWESSQRLPVSRTLSKCTGRKNGQGD